MGENSFDITKIKRELLQEMKATKGSRFNAAKRLETRDKKMITLTAFSSIYVLVLTILPLLFHVSDIFISATNGLIILISLVILAASLLQYSNNDPVRAEQLHRCALEVNALRRELRATDGAGAVELTEFSRRYDAVLLRYAVNHDAIDFDKYKREHPDEYQMPDPEVTSGPESSLTLDGSWTRYAMWLMSIAAIAMSLYAAADQIGMVRETLSIIARWAS